MQQDVGLRLKCLGGRTYFNVQLMTICAVVKCELCSCSCKFWTGTVEKLRKECWKAWNFENEWCKKFVFVQLYLQRLVGLKHKKWRKQLKKASEVFVDEIEKIFVND